MDTMEVPESSNPRGALMWKRFFKEFPSKTKFGDIEIPNPHAIRQRAERLRQNPNAGESNFDELNDPAVLTAIAEHLTALLQGQEAELAEIAETEEEFRHDANWQRREAYEQCENAIAETLEKASRKPGGLIDKTA